MHLETSLVIEKAVNLLYWGPILNVRIFVYIKNKTKMFGQILYLCHGGPRAQDPYVRLDISRCQKKQLDKLDSIVAITLGLFVLW